MSWRTAGAVVQLRAVGRKLGLNTKLRALIGHGRYEAGFHDAMMAVIRPGDLVWDVGANVGFYTRQFADAVGASGSVVAFEPGPGNLDLLRAAMADRANVSIQPVALGGESGSVSFEESGGIGTVSRVSIGTASATAIQVAVRRGDDMTAEAGVPNVLKIDVEGYELGVLQGLTATLADRAVRHLCIEVHFSLLAQRGQKDAPGKIEAMLRKNGFTITWCDASHLLASRV